MGTEWNWCHCRGVCDWNGPVWTFYSPLSQLLLEKLLKEEPLNPLLATCGRLVPCSLHHRLAPALILVLCVTQYATLNEIFGTPLYKINGLKVMGLETFDQVFHSFTVIPCSLVIVASYSWSSSPFSKGEEIFQIIDLMIHSNDTQYLFLEARSYLTRQ